MTVYDLTRGMFARAWVCSLLGHRPGKYGPHSETVPLLTHRVRVTVYGCKCQRCGAVR